MLSHPPVLRDNVPSPPSQAPTGPWAEGEDPFSPSRPGRLAVGPLGDRDEHLRWSAILPHPAAHERVGVRDATATAMLQLASLGPNAEAHLKRQMSQFVSRSERLKPASALIRQGLGADIQAVNDQLHYALFEEEIRELSHPDVALSSDIRGFRLFASATETNGVFPKKPKPVPVEKLPHEVLRTREDHKNSMPTCATRDAGELYQRSLQSVRAGKDKGPFTADTAPHDSFASSLRFMVRAEGKKPRECDDARRSGVNATSELSETVPMPGLTGVFALVIWLMILFPKTALVAGSEDFDSAFTQVPLHPDQQRYSYYHVLDDQGRVAYFFHVAGWFGPRLMPHAWCRIMELLITILALRFCIPAAVHMDDLVVVLPKLTSEFHLRAVAAVKLVCRHLGLRLSPKKSRLPAQVQQALGGLITLPLSGEDVAKVELPPDKKQKYIERLRNWSTQDQLPPDIAAKIAGYSQVLDSAHFGRVARAYLWPIYHRANHYAEDSSMTPALRFSIIAIAKLMEDSKPRLLRPLVQRPIIRIYGDARGSPEHLAAVAFAPDGTAHYWSSPVQPSWGQFLDPYREENRITQLETLWMPISVRTFGAMYTSVDVLFFQDNEAALGAVTKGYSPNVFIACATSEFWLACSDVDWHVWIYAVASEANPADPISRPGTAETDRFPAERGWIRIRPSALEPHELRLPFHVHPRHEPSCAPATHQASLVPKGPQYRRQTLR